MFWVHTVQNLYLIVPGTSALVLLFFAVFLIWEIYRSRLSYLNVVGWCTFTILVVLGGANIWVFTQIYGIMAARSVLG